MRIRLLTDMKGRWSGGRSDLDYYNTRRGDVVEATDKEGGRLVRLGYACTDLKCDLHDLPLHFRTKAFLGRAKPRAKNSSKDSVASTVARVVRASACDMSINVTQVQPNNQ